MLMLICASLAVIEIRHEYSPFYPPTSGNSGSKSFLKTSFLKWMILRKLYELQLYCFFSSFTIMTPPPTCTLSYVAPKRMQKGSLPRHMFDPFSLPIFFLLWVPFL